MQNIVRKSTRAALLATGIVTLSACSAETTFANFFRESGSQLDTGEFGNATLHNQLAQTCRTSGSGYGKGVGKAGGAAGDPLVVLDPESTGTRKVYRVYCDGRLDGKYAQVIYSEYVTSAKQTPTVERADSE